LAICLKCLIFEASATLGARPWCGGLGPVLLGQAGQALNFFNVESQSMSYSAAIIFICLEEDGSLTVPDAFLGVAQARHDVARQLVAVIVS
jgi:hypothetical protein